jgi:signal transduction histidine kinase
VVADLREGREVVGREFRFKKKNGESLTGLFSAQIIHLQNEPCILSSIDDISARKTVESQREAALEEVCRTAEALREKNKELTRFTNAVSHDLRSPLVTVQTFLGHLESDLRDQNQERVVEDFGFIKAAADKMGRLLDELLRLSRVGRMINPAVEMPLQAVVQDALDITAGRIAGRGVRVVVTNEPVVLYGDRARLTEIFQNLVDNAAKFMGGQPAPRIEIGVEESGGELVLYVRDNGIGLDPNFSPRLFGLFEKFDPAADGVGLGLALIRRIVELHGGRIWAESEGLGRGTTFRFTLARTRRDSFRKDHA